MKMSKSNQCYLFAVIIFYCIEIITSSIQELTLNNQDLELINFTKKIYLEECILCRTTLMFYSENKMPDQFLESISKYHKPTLFLTAQLRNYSVGLKYNLTAEKPDMIIFFLDENSCSFPKIIHSIRSFKVWNIRAKHVFVVSGEMEEDHENWLKESFKALWKKQVLRVLICFHLNGALKVITYNPFLEQYNIDVTTSSDLSTKFAHKITDMNGYPIKLYNFDVFLNVVTLKNTIKNGKIEYIGYDGKFMGTFVESLNASMVVYNISDDFNLKEIQQNPNVSLSFADGLLHLTSLHDFDMFANIIRIDTNNLIDKLFLNERNDYIFVVPNGQKIPGYLYLTTIVSAIWVPILTTFTLVSLSIGIIRRFKSVKSSWLDILSDNFSLLFYTSAPNRRRGGQERFILILWILHCIIFDTLFTSILMSTLVKPKFYPHIKTLEELYESNLKIHCAKYPADKMRISINDSRLENHLAIIPTSVSTFGANIGWIKPYRDSGFMLFRNEYNRLRKYEKYVGRRPYTVMDETPCPYIEAYGILKNKLYYREFQDILGRIQSSGLYIYWRDHNYGLEKENISLNTPIAEPEISGNQPLTLVHLQSGFMLLAVGHAFSLVVFIIEIIIKKYNDRRTDIFLK